MAPGTRVRLQCAVWNPGLRQEQQQQPQAAGGATSNKPPNSRRAWVNTSSRNGCTKFQCQGCPSPSVLSLLLERGGSFETGTLTLTLHCILWDQPRASQESNWKSIFTLCYHLSRCFLPASLFQRATPRWIHHCDLARPHCAPSVALGLLKNDRLPET